MKIDYYRVLGIARDASRSEIKQAFRKLALQFHPDRHVRGSIASRESAGHRFKEVSEAYEVLGDEVKRAAYNKGSHYTGSQHTGSSRRYEGPPRRQYYRNRKEGYNTYGSAQARSFYEGSHGVRWKPELSGPERRERIINTIFFGIALPLFLFADYIGAALWPDPSQRKPYSAMNKAVQGTRDDRKAVQTSCSAKKPKASSMRGLRDQGCKSLLESKSVGYTYVASRGLGNLEGATNLAPKLPDNTAVPTFNSHYLRSLLTPECRLSDLPNVDLHTWLGQRARILHNREST